MKERIERDMVCVRERCGYRWVSRIASPKCCPKCKCRLDVGEVSSDKGDEFLDDRAIGLD